MRKEETIIGMMVEYFLNDINDESVIKEMASTILWESYDMEPEEAVVEANRLVDELWVEADSRADMANQEAYTLQEARLGALRGDMLCR